MSAFLIVDVDDVTQYLEAQNFMPNMLDVAVSLRNAAALAVGLSNPEMLTAIAVADWNQYSRITSAGTANLQQIFASTGYNLFNVADQRYVADALLTDYFPMDADTPIEELIIASSREDFQEIIDRLRLPSGTRVRVWADVNPFREGIIFQDLEAILAVKSKSVALYIDFENISISLNEQGYVVDLDTLIHALKNRAAQYGQLLHMAAYAPWGQRGSLPPMLDQYGREISDDVPSRLALESIDPVFSLPGKNSADLRIAKDVMAESASVNSAEIVIIASGDRDFNDIYNSLRARGKQVVVWGVRGSTSRVLENNSVIKLEYIDDFALFRRHEELSSLYQDTSVIEFDMDIDNDFRPSQWSSLVLQFDYLQAANPRKKITTDDLTRRLDEVNTTVNTARAQDLIEQGLRIGIMRRNKHSGALSLNKDHPVVAKTHTIRDHIVNRVSNTLSVRKWDYVNYGFLLKGIAMDEKLNEPGLNTDDNWRSEWIDFLVREGILERELIPHRHNPDDLVPVIRVPDDALETVTQTEDDTLTVDDIDDMVQRIVVSIEQFTSFRNFVWCPLGSLHKRLRPFDGSTAFQQAVEVLQGEGAVDVSEYENPQSQYKTKGVSINLEAPRVQSILAERDRVVRALLDLYEARQPITYDDLQALLDYDDHQMQLWISIMELENILNRSPNQPGYYSLFRMHHTVSLVADD
ncbi:MAG: NYN domain-containing protein [Anaerolineales bacterium]